MMELDRIIGGDCLEQLRTLPEGSVDCCITSPPYFGLRDYGVPGQIGLEASPKAYVARLVEVFREVRRVLKPEGTLWLNLGDSYASSDGNNPDRFDKSAIKSDRYRESHLNGTTTIPSGLKPKDLIGIPWMVAFALRADGWYLRSDIIWHKPNCMPESATDRPTKSHEYLFLLSKNKKYYYDAEAIKEDAAYPKDKRRPVGSKGAWQMDGREQRANGGGLPYDHDTTKRNRRSVWTITTKPFSEAHFATFPEKLVEPCILAGTSEKGVCPACGKPWVRQVERNNPSKQFNTGEDERYAGMKGMGGNHQTVAGLHRNGGGVYSTAKTIGWLPSCSCDLPPQPAVVLDPFFGAGTVGVVAKKLGRRFIGIELNTEYVAMAKARIEKVPISLSRWEEDARP